MGSRVLRGGAPRYFSGGRYYGVMRRAFLCLLLLGALGPSCAQGSPPIRPDDGGSMDATTPADARPADAATTDGRPSADAPGCSTNRETCNGEDDDCDGVIDEDPVDGTTYYRDNDSDSWGSDTDTVEACEQPADAVARGGDCQDGNELVHPEQADTCDGLDNDCSGGIDDMGCPATCTPVAFGGHGYAFCTANVGWSQARDACSAFGLRLVRVDTIAESTFLWDTASAGIGDFWVGARVDADGTRRWRWTDGTEFWEGTLGGSAVDGIFAAWEMDQPDDDAPPSCAMARDRMSGRWHDTSCSTTNDYVCERY